MQELLTVNISMRIITEDNIEQLENMTKSNNIDLLLQKKDTNINDIITEIRTKLKNQKKLMMPY